MEGTIMPIEIGVGKKIFDYRSVSLLPDEKANDWLAAHKSSSLRLPPVLV